MKEIPDLSDAIVSSVDILREIIALEAQSNTESRVRSAREINTKYSEKLFEPFKTRYQEFEPELVWEYSLIGNHYQTMLFHDDETVTISVCPNHYIPWALRNAVHPKDSDFVVVNGNPLGVENVVQIIDEHLDNANVRERIVNHIILKNQFEQMEGKENERLQPDEKELENEFNQWRLNRGLATVNSYHEYLKANGLTHKVIEERAREKLVHNKFLETLCHKSIDEYFAGQPVEFTRYKLEVYVAGLEESVELASFLKTNPDGLCVWARNRFLSNPPDKAQNNYRLNSCWHYQLDPEVVAILADKPETGLLPPIEMNGKINIINVLSITPPALDDQTQSIIRQRQVGDWITERKKTSNIQWLWGDKDIFQNQNIQES